MDLQSPGTLDQGKTRQKAVEENVYPVGEFLYVPGAWPGAGTLEKPSAPGIVSGK